MTISKGDPVIVVDVRAFSSNHYREFFAQTVKGRIGLVTEVLPATEDTGRLLWRQVKKLVGLHAPAPPPRALVRWKLQGEHGEVENYAANLPVTAVERRFPPGTTIIGPCGYGAEVAEDCGAPVIIIEHYNGDREPLRRSLVGQVISVPDIPA
ncbi:MAG: hypothetical protein GC129_07015 [Proteobacteria bacterium]|nr:hypothetical protein [Pseudomonadota bacterium]